LWSRKRQRIHFTCINFIFDTLYIYIHGKVLCLIWIFLKMSKKELELSLKSNKNYKFWLSFENSDQGIICDLKCKYRSMVIKKCLKSLNEKNEIEMPNTKEAICMIREAKIIANWWKPAIKQYLYFYCNTLVSIILILIG